MQPEHGPAPAIPLPVEIHPKAVSEGRARNQGIAHRGIGQAGDAAEQRSHLLPLGAGLGARLEVLQVAAAALSIMAAGGGRPEW